MFMHANGSVAGYSLYLQYRGDVICVPQFIYGLRILVSRVSNVEEDLFTSLRPTRMPPSISFYPLMNVQRLRSAPTSYSILFSFQVLRGPGLLRGWCSAKAGDVNDSLIGRKMKWVHVRCCPLLCCCWGSRRAGTRATAHKESLLMTESWVILTWVIGTSYRAGLKAATAAIAGYLMLDARTAQASPCQEQVPHKGGGG